DVNCQIEAVDLVLNGQLERRVDVAFLFVSAYVNIGVIRPAIGELVNKPRIPMEIEDHGLITGKKCIEITIGETMGMFCAWLKPIQIDNIDKADLKLWKML